MSNRQPSTASSDFPSPTTPTGTDLTFLTRCSSSSSIDTLVDGIDPEVEGVTLTRSHPSNRTFGSNTNEVEDTWGLGPDGDVEEDASQERMFHTVPTPVSRSDASMHSVDNLATATDSDVPCRVFLCSVCVQPLPQKDNDEQSPALFMCSADGCEAKFCTSCAVSCIAGETKGCNHCGGPGLPILAPSPSHTGATSFSPTIAQRELATSCWSKILKAAIDRFRADSEFATTGPLVCLAFYLWIGKRYTWEGKEFPLPYEMLQAAWEESFGERVLPAGGAESAEIEQEDCPPSRDEENMDPRHDPYAAFSNIFLRVEALYEGMHALYLHPQGALILAHIHALTDEASVPSPMTQDERLRFEHDLLEIMFNHCINARRLYAIFCKEGVLRPSAVPNGVSVGPDASLQELLHALAALPPDFNAFNYLFGEADNVMPGSPLRPKRPADMPRSRDLFHAFDEWEANSFSVEQPRTPGLSRWSNAPEVTDEWYAQMSETVKELVQTPPADAASNQPGMDHTPMNHVPGEMTPWTAAGVLTHVGASNMAQDEKRVIQDMSGLGGWGWENVGAQGGSQASEPAQRKDSGVPAQDTDTSPFTTPQKRARTTSGDYYEKLPLMPALEPSRKQSPHSRSPILAEPVYNHDVARQSPTYSQYVPPTPSVCFASNGTALFDLAGSPPKTPTRRGNLSNSKVRTQSMVRLVGSSPHVPKPRTPSSNRQTPRKARSTSSIRVPDEKGRTPKKTMAQAIGVFSQGKNGGGGDAVESPAKKKLMELWRPKVSRPATPSGSPIPISNLKASGEEKKENLSPSKGQKGSQLFKRPSFFFGGGGEGLGSGVTVKRSEMV